MEYGDKVGLHRIPSDDRILEGLPSGLQILKPVSYVMRAARYNDPAVKQRPADHTKMGWFYEVLSAALYGGKLTTREIVHANSSQLSLDLGLVQDEIERAINWDSMPESRLVKPDGFDLDIRKFWESKAWRGDEEVHLGDAQLERYRQMQGKYPQCECHTHFYAHPLFGIKSKKLEMSEFQMLEALAGNTLYSVSVPLEVVLFLHGKVYGPGINPKYAYTFAGPKYNHCSMARATARRGFMTNPEEVIEGIGLNPDYFTYDLQRTSASMRFAVQGKVVKLKPFPVRVIRHKDHAAWIERFTAMENSIGRVIVNGGDGDLPDFLADANPDDSVAYVDHELEGNYVGGRVLEEEETLPF